MAKTHQKPAEDTSSLGKDTILTIAVPRAQFVVSYERVLQSTGAKVKVPGFRQGKAPKALVEDTVGIDRLTSDALSKIVPSLYSEEVKKQNIVPLVEPSFQIKEMKDGEDILVEAVTAVAPVVVLGDYQKIVKSAVKDWEKLQTEKKSDKVEKPTPETQNQDKLRAVFQALILAIKPAIAPKLVEHEMDRQIGELLKQLKQMRVELPDFLKASGKTIETLEQEYAGMSLASLQLEFVLLAITSDLKIEATEKEINEYLGKGSEKLDAHLKEHLASHATDIIKRRKTVDAILAFA